jgi:hypothetical protein
MTTGCGISHNDTICITLIEISHNTNKELIVDCWKFLSLHNMHSSENMRDWQLVYETDSYSFCKHPVCHSKITGYLLYLQHMYFGFSSFLFLETCFSINIPSSPECTSRLPHRYTYSYSIHRLTPIQHNQHFNNWFTSYRRIHKIQEFNSIAIPPNRT